MSLHSARYGSVLSILLISVFWLLVSPTPMLAQSCDTFIDAYRYASSQDACRFINNNYGCYGYTTSAGSPARTNIDGFRFNRPRDRQPVLKFSDIKTFSPNGAVLMLLKALTRSSVTMILFGDSELTPTKTNSFILRITDSQPLCESTPSGLVARSESGQQGLVTINGVAIELGSTAYITMDGSEQIAHYSKADGDFEIYTMNSIGGNVRQLTRNRASDIHATWSPDGTQVVFQSDRDGDYEIFTMNEDGNDLRQLTRNNSSDDHPSWSPDGRRIAFDSGSDGDREIYTVDLFGRNQIKLTSNTQHDRWPVWSPDGRQIAFYSDLDGDYDIYIMNSDGSSRRKLVDNPRDDRYPAWSPDGQRIAFSSDVDGDWEIYVIRSDGSELEQITRNSDAVDWGPTWSPNGLAIGFASTRDGDNEIYVMDADGTNVRQITNNRDSDELPIWQPMVFSSDESMTVTNMEGQVVVSIPNLEIRRVVPVGAMVQIDLNDGVPVDITGPINSPFFTSQVVRWLRDVGLPSIVNPNESTVEGVPPCGAEIEYGAILTDAISTPGQECLYTFFGSAGDIVDIDMTAVFAATDSATLQVLDPWLDLRDPEDNLVTFNDDISESPNSSIQRVTLPVSGRYTIVARSYENGSSGPFELRLRIRPRDL